jgi:hypothetical protein
VDVTRPGYCFCALPFSLAQAQSDQHSKRRRYARERQNGYRDDEERGPWSACDEEPAAAASISTIWADSAKDKRNRRTAFPIYLTEEYRHARSRG